MKLLLASSSPRRKELLSQLGYQFETIKIDIDESYPKDLETQYIAEYISAKKANAQVIGEDEILLTADTIVAMGQEILLKPKSREEAFVMLKNLSGKTHQVYSAFTIKTNNSEVSKTSKTDVELDKMSENEINFYIDHYQPFDKAGSYGVQEWLGMAKIKNINGSFYSVMGLPTDLVYKELKEMGCFPIINQNHPL